MRKFLASILLAVASVAGVFAQQPQTSNAPISLINAKYVQGVGTGFWPTAGSGLNLNITAGTSYCSNTISTYAGGSVLLTNSTTNYVFLSSSCVVTTNTTGFVANSLPIATVTTSGGAITVIQDDRTMFTPPGGTSSNAVLYNASSTTYTMTGSSVNGDDNHILGSAITVTGGSSSGGVCTVTNSGTNGLAAGDWVYTASITGWPAQAAAFGVYTYGSSSVNDDQFQVISTGLSTTQFEFNCPNTGSHSFSGGSAYPSNAWFTHIVEVQPFINTHGTVNAIFDSTHTCSGINTNFATLFPNVSGHVAYFILTDCHNEYNTGVSAPTTEGYIQSIMAKAHTAGYLFILGTTPSAQLSALNNGSFSYALNTVNWWSYLQAKSPTNKASGQYADGIADFNAELNNWAFFGGNNAGIGAVGANPIAAAVLNEAIVTQNWSPKTALFSACYYGNVTGVLAQNGGPGIVCSPASNLDAFVITDGTQANIAFRVDTSGTIGIRASSISDSGIGQSTKLICTNGNSNGQLINNNCDGYVSTVQDTTNSLFITPIVGAVTAALNLVNSNTWTNTQTIQAQSPTGVAAVLQGTTTTAPFVRATCSGNPCTINGVQTGDLIIMIGFAGGTFPGCANDSNGQAYTCTNFGGTNQTSSWGYHANSSSGNITFTTPGGMVYDIGGAATASPIDVTFTSSNLTLTSPQTITLGATSVAKDLILVGTACGFDAGCVQNAFAAGYKLEFSNGFSQYIRTYSRVVTATGTYSASWNWTVQSGNTSFFAWTIAIKGLTGGTQSGDMLDIQPVAGVTSSLVNANAQFVPPTAAGTPGNTPANGGAIQNDSTANCARIYTGGSWVCFLKDFPAVWDVPAANCNNATAGAGWSLPTSAAPTAACRTGSNIQTGVLQFAASNTAQFSIDLPNDYDSAGTVYAKIQFTQGANTTSGQTIIMQIATACQSTTDDPSFNSAQAFATATTVTTAQTAFSETLSSVTMTGCTAGQRLNIQISRSGSDTASTSPNVYGVSITIPRLLVNQAN